MELLPSEYQSLDLNRHEKVFIRHACNSCEDFGFVLLKINPATIVGEYVHAVILNKGLLFLRFYPVDNATVFPMFISAIRSGIYETTVSAISNKLLTNKALLENGKLFFPYASICVFPALNKSDINFIELSEDIRDFIEGKCMFAEDFAHLRGNFKELMDYYLQFPEVAVSEKQINIDEKNVNSIIQRIAPEYTTIRYAISNEENSTPGASEELIVVSEDDVAVRAYRLDAEQINIINKMAKGDQLILACAGSGKSVLLIAKCFKAAKMNPDKKFLITCFNRNLRSLYTWFIERAGLQERNVDCMTYDALCKKLLTDNNLPVPTGQNAFPLRRKAAFAALCSGNIANKYYGIFIDEVQMFETEWYKLCYDLLENRDNPDHIFIICGDKTQEIRQRQRHGRAPWNAGEGYPVYRGGNRSIRIEKNYRNCIEINEFINRYAIHARQVLQEHIPDLEFDPDMFLRGQAFRHGNSVVLKQVVCGGAAEAKMIVESIESMHTSGVPYDELAIAMFNRKYAPMHYYLESPLQEELIRKHIPFCLLYSTDQNWSGNYGEGGVSLLTFDSALGLDFQGVVVCGIRPLGAHDRTKKMAPGKELSEEEAEQLKKNISSLYVACTRAKDHLHIILTESSSQSLYCKLLTDSI